MAGHGQTDFTPLLDRDPRVSKYLVENFDYAVNAAYYDERHAESFDAPQGITDFQVLVDLYVRKSQLASNSTMEDTYKRMFKEHAEYLYLTPETMQTLSITLLRLASYLPCTHPGHIFLKEILVDFFVHTAATQPGQAPTIFRAELLDLWSRFRPVPGNNGDGRMKALLQPDEWVNFNSFVAILCNDMEIDYDNFAFQGLGLLLLDPMSTRLNQALSADFGALTACIWIHCADSRLLHSINQSDGLVFKDHSGQEWSLDKHTWLRMTQNFGTILRNIKNTIIYQRSNAMWYQFAEKGQNVNSGSDQNMAL
ncbi:uncharacterized protein G6M90_00g055300 [Metarhizium brunneum]|uniref:Uncharacterized protein n=1 Tax=Metarhizium brunneum TaxID=500148 RepID=A0A7D5YUA0_9HYPO